MPTNTASHLWHIFTALLIATAGVSSQSTTVRPPPTLPNCDGIAPVPNYHANCNATNSFTLPNGRFVDEYNRYCACAEVVLNVQRLACQGVQDLPGYRCNADGTFNCRVPAFAPGGSFCLSGSESIGPDTIPRPPNCTLGFCEPACLRYAKDTQRFQNVRNCPCIQALNQLSISICISEFLSPHGCPVPANNYIPQCNVDGSWKKLQTGYGGCWCVDANGNQKGDISFDAAYPHVC